MLPKWRRADNKGCMSPDKVNSQTEGATDGEAKIKEFLPIAWASTQVHSHAWNSNVTSHKTARQRDI